MALIGHGQKVVCISKPPGYERGAVPEVGKVYTVRSVEDEHDGGDVCITLVEVVNTRCLCWLDDGRRVWGEPNFELLHFRPVKTTNIDVFREILERAGDGAKAKEREDA